MTLTGKNIIPKIETCKLIMHRNPDLTLWIDACGLLANTVAW